MSEEKEGSPENGRADGEVVLEMACGRSKVRFRLAVFIEARPAKTFVGMLIVLGEVQAVFDERGAGKRVITDAIAAHPRVEEWEREKKKEYEQALGFMRAGKRRWTEVLLIHERGTRRNFSYPRQPSVRHSTTMWNQTPRTEEGTW